MAIVTDQYKITLDAVDNVSKVIQTAKNKAKQLEQQLNLMANGKNTITMDLKSQEFTTKLTALKQLVQSSIGKQINIPIDKGGFIQLLDIIQKNRGALQGTALAIKQVNQQISKIGQAKRLVDLGFTKQNAIRQIQQFQRDIDGIPLEKKVDLVVGKAKLDLAQQKRQTEQYNKVLQNTQKISQQFNKTQTSMIPVIDNTGKSVSVIGKAFELATKQMQANSQQWQAVKKIHDSEQIALQRLTVRMRSKAKAAIQSDQAMQKMGQTTENVERKFLDFAKGMQQPFEYLNKVIPGLGFKLQALSTGAFGLQTII